MEAVPDSSQDQANQDVVVDAAPEPPAPAPAPVAEAPAPAPVAKAPAPVEAPIDHGDHDVAVDETPAAPAPQTPAPAPVAKAPPPVEAPMDHDDHDVAVDETPAAPAPQTPVQAPVAKAPPPVEAPMDHGDHDVAVDETPAAPAPQTPAPAPVAKAPPPVEAPMDHDDHDVAVDETPAAPAPQTPVQAPVAKAPPPVEAPMDHDDHDVAVDETPAAPAPQTPAQAPVAKAPEPVEPHMDHGDHGMDPALVSLPTSQDEIAAYVAAVRARPETHNHDDDSSKAGEHMAAMDLVPRAEATHIAIGHGDWNDASNWHNGEVPGDDARVLIPEGVHMTYDHVSDARLFTVRVDGKLEFATDVDSQMIVDTIVTTPGSHLQIGTEENPIDANVDVDIIFANNGPIDVDWDPLLLSRGMIGHGKVDIHGTAKDSHEKVVDDPKIGDTWIDMGEAPEGWAVGDTIVIAGTSYQGYLGYDPSAGYVPPEDEIRVITEITDGLVFFEDPLVFDHGTPRDDLKTSVANYTRNVSFETEDADLAEIHERGHVMFMHNGDVDVRYAEFHELGRTDKSELSLGADDFLSLDSDTNVKGRYAFHFHRAGLEDQDAPAIAEGNAVFGSPGWGFVHHESNAILENNATYDTFGAGYVAENGTETGAWIDNIAIFSQGTSGRDPKLGNGRLDDFDLGRTGDGFWFQGRMVESVDNVAASVNNGFVYFHRGTPGGDELTKIDTDWSDIPFYADHLTIDDHPILGFSGNEAFASKMGLYILKANPDQGHDVHSVLEDFTGWNLKVGAELSYTAHYTLKGFDLVAAEDASPTSFGIGLGLNASDIAIVDSTIEGFGEGIHLNHDFTIRGDSAEDTDYTIVNPTFIDVQTDIAGYDPTLDTVLSTEDLPYLTPDIALDRPLTYKEGWKDPDAREIEISGTKTDSLGTTDITGGADDYTVHFSTAVSAIAEEGYYTTSDGQNYSMYEFYFSDRLTGDIYMEKHPVFLDDNVWVERGYANAEFKGVQDFGVEGDPTIDSAILWATLTKGQVVLSDEALALEAEEEPILEMDSFL